MSKVTCKCSRILSDNKFPSFFVHFWKNLSLKIKIAKSALKVILPPYYIASAHVTNFTFML